MTTEARRWAAYYGGLYERTLSALSQAVQDESAAFALWSGRAETHGLTDALTREARDTWRSKQAALDEVASNLRHQRRWLMEPIADVEREASQ